MAEAKKRGGARPGAGRPRRRYVLEFDTGDLYQQVDQLGSVFRGYEEAQEHEKQDQRLFAFLFTKKQARRIRRLLEHYHAVQLRFGVQPSIPNIQDFVACMITDRLSELENVFEVPAMIEV